MRFLAGAFFGSVLVTVLSTTICKAWFAPAVESYPEFKTLSEKNFQLGLENTGLKYRLLAAELDLDTLRRSQRDPVNPKGKEVAPEDRIPPQALPTMPAPLPTNPLKKDENDKDEMNDQQPQQEKGEEKDMAANEKKPTTAIAKSLGASLAIQSVDELLKLATILYNGGASQIPGCGRPEAVAHVILAGAEVGLTPTQALSTIMLVNGKTAVYGDGAMALVLASGLLEEIKEWSEGEGDNLTYFCRVKRKGDTEAITRQFSVADAKKAELWEKKDNWKKYWKRMMVMRPRGYAFRDRFADVLKGLQFWEEVVDASHDLSVVNAEVKVIGFNETKMVQAESKAEPPQPWSESFPAARPGATVEEPKQLASATPADEGPITEEQKLELARLNQLIMAGKGLHEPFARKAAWVEILAPYGVDSMNKMTQAVAAKAITDLQKAHDPFTSGQFSGGSKAA